MVVFLNSRYLFCASFLSRRPNRRRCIAVVARCRSRNVVINRARQGAIRDLNLVGVTSQRSGCKSKHTACCLDGNIASGFVRVVDEFIKMHARIHVFCDRYHIVPAPNLLILHGMIFIGEKNDKLN